MRMIPTRIAPSRRVRNMRPSGTTALMLALAMLMLVASPAIAQTPSHGGSLTNTHNDIYIVESDAQNPQGIDAGYEGLFVKETISFSNDDPLKVPDYGIVYVDPSFSPDSSTPIVVAYTHEYTIANYTLQLINLTDSWAGNLTGFTSTSATLQPGTDLGPEGPDEPHPKVNATYQWRVHAISEQNRTMVSETGGEVTTEIFNDTVLDWSTLGLPTIGPHSYEADSADLAEMTLQSKMEPHPSLSDGWYRFRIGEEVFEYGVNLTIELRYSGVMDGGSITMNKLVFTERIIHLDVYHRTKVDVLMFSDIGGKGIQISPTQASSGPGEPTKFTHSTTFSLIVREEGAEGETDWGLYGRYALLAILIVVLLFLVLWSGRDKRPREDGEGELVEDPETAAKRAQLQSRKDKVLAELKELDRRHDEGEIGEGVWKRKRRSLKNRYVEVMRELDDLGSPSTATNGDLSEDYADLRELEREKERLLERIRALDDRHEDGEVDEDEWKRQRKALKSEVVVLMRRMEELEED